MHVPLTNKKARGRDIVLVTGGENSYDCKNLDLLPHLALPKNIPPDASSGVRGIEYRGRRWNCVSVLGIRMPVMYNVCPLSVSFGFTVGQCIVCVCVRMSFSMMGS